MKSLSRINFLIVALIGSAIFLALFLYFIPKILIQNDPVSLAENAVLVPWGNIKIPKINIDTIVVRVGLTPEGEMDIPKKPDEVGWFDLGPRPGEIGSAVISGHYGWKDNIPAVFDNLHKLQKGDKIYFEDEKGVVTVFVVRESRTYGENEDASDVFGSRDGKAHLNLITCSGTWNKDKESYSTRLVVFTDKE